MSGMTTDPEWEPGDALFPTSGAQYRQHLFNFRDDEDPGPEPGPDAARWPEPDVRKLLPGDEIGAFIVECRRWRQWLLSQEGV